MKISNFNFFLPEELIPQYPDKDKGNARLMVVHRSSGKIEHKKFGDIVTYFSKGDGLVVNDSKVSPWLLQAKKEKVETKIDVVLLRELNPTLHIWDAKVEPARKIRVGNRLYFGNNRLMAEILDNTTSRGRTLKFTFSGPNQELHTILDSIGYIYMPSKINRGPQESDKEDYQTIYAQKVGGVVAPSAGLNFTSQVLKKLDLNDIHFIPITMHIGTRMLEPIDVEDVPKYKIDAERVIITSEAATQINQILEHPQKKLCAVGTSTLRAIESSIKIPNKLISTDGLVNSFIHSSCQISACKALLTNFHLPQSSCFVTTSAFAGTELLMQAYVEAIYEKYNFFVYGDSMLIL